MEQEYEGTLLGLGCTSSLSLVQCLQWIPFLALISLRRIRTESAISSDWEGYVMDIDYSCHSLIA
jgi:hypothetical protein